MQRFKIGMVYPQGEDAWMSEDQLDLNRGWPDRRGPSKSSKVWGVRRS